MSLFPDNQKRANRVNQLSADIAHIQAQIKADVEDARKQDGEALKLLDQIAKDAGYKTLDEYIDAATKQMPAEEKAALEKMKDDMEKLDEDMQISHKVFRGLIAVGLLTRGIRIFAIGFKETQSILFGLQALLKSIYYALAGAVESAVKFMTWGRVTLNLVSRAGGLTEEALEGLKFLRIGGNVLMVIGILVDAVLLIYEAIHGAQQRIDLQNGIKDLCGHRFIVKQLQQEARAILNFKSDAKSIVKIKTKYDEWVKKGKMTEEEVHNELKPEMEKVQDGIKEEINKITADAIWKALDTQDTESHVAWRDEDPSLASILEWAKNKEKPDQK